MKVLIACEFSGIVRSAFEKVGCDAVSIDFLPTEIPGRHIRGNVLDYLNHNWDLMIAHPPCKYLAVSGARWFKDRMPQQEAAIWFVEQLLIYNEIPKICLENPVSVISTYICKPNQYIQPWQFGHGETKKTGLWLKNLPLLKATNIVKGRKSRVHYESPGPDRWKNRSRFFPGIAKAMAEQWGTS